MAEDRLGLPEGFELDKPPIGFVEDEIDSSLLPGKSEGLSYVQGKPPTFNIKDIFREDPAKLRAKASNAMAYSEWFNISPSQAYEFHDEISEQLGGEHLTTPELMGGLLTLPIAAGLATNPMGVVLGIGAFEAVGEAESAAISVAKGEEYKIFQKKGLKDLLPDDVSRVTSDVVDVMDFIGKALVAKSAFKRTPKIVEKLSKQIIEEHNLPKSVFIDPKELKAELQTGGVLPAEEMNIVKELGLTGSEYRQAIKDGIHIEIPAEKISIVRDRPWFARLKSLFKIDPAQEKFVTKEGKPTYRFGEGEPQEVAKKEIGAKAIEYVKPEVKVVPKPTEGVVEPLEAEAKKYKTAEEFVEGGREVEVTTKAKPIKEITEEARKNKQYKYAHIRSIIDEASEKVSQTKIQKKKDYWNDKKEEWEKALKGLIASNIDWVKVNELKLSAENLIDIGLGKQVQGLEKIEIAEPRQFPASKAETGKPIRIKAYHGTDRKFEIFDQKGGEEIYFSDNKEGAKTYIDKGTPGGHPHIMERDLFLNNPYVVDAMGESWHYNIADKALDKARDGGHDSVVIKNVEDFGAPTHVPVHNVIMVIDPDVIKTKAQLTDIWNKAHKQKPEKPKVKEPSIPTEEPITEYEIAELNKIDKQITAQASRQAEINVSKRLGEKLSETKEDVLPLLIDEEAKLLKQATKKYKIKPAKGLKKFIREETGQVKVKEIMEVKPGEIINYAMKEAQKAARVAFRTGNKEGLAKAKAKYREALEKKLARDYTRGVIKKIVKDLKGIDVEKLTPAQVEPVKNLLAGLDFTKPTSKTLLKLSKTREYLENNPDAEIPDYVMERLSRLDKKNVRDITLEELESIHDAVMHRVHLSKLVHKIKVRRKLQEEAEVLKDSIIEMKPRDEVKSNIVSSQQGVGGRKSAGKLLKDTFGIRHDHYDLIVESLAGPNSTMDKVLYQGVKEGIIRQLKYRQDVYSKFETEANKIGIKDVSEWLTEEIKTGKFKLTRNERMALYNHSKNSDNRRSIIEGGFGFRTSPDPNKVFKITESELNDIIGSLTKEEKAFADIWDKLSEEQYKALNKVFLEKNGYNLPKEENYYPKEVMPLARGKDFESEEALEKLKGTWTRIGIEKGMLEKRRRVNLPIYLNSFTYDVNKSVMKSAAYVGLEIPLSNASKLLYNPDFKRELSERYEKITWTEIEKGLRDIAGDWQSYTTTEELILKVKNNITTAVLGLNPFVMAKQILSLPVYLPYIKNEYLVQGFTDYLNNEKDAMARHELFSPEFRERMIGGYSRDVADIFKGAAEKRLYGGRKSIKENVMGGIQLFDKYAVASGMQGAVLQVLDEFKAGKLSNKVSVALDMTNEDIAALTPEDKMRLAYRYADYATERTQPMFSPEHRSSLSRGATIEKLATMFGAFTNQALNLVRRTSREGTRTGNYDALAKSLFVIFIVNTLGVMAIDEIRNRIYKRDGGNVFGRILNSWSGYVFFLRDLVSSVVSKIERGTFMGYDVSWPITRVPELISNVAANGVTMMTEENKAKREKAARKFVDDSLNLTLMLNGIPYETPKKLGKAALEATK